jgi:hypothetical protein
VGILCFSHRFLVKILEPSSCEASLLGPKTLILFASKKSTIPSTNGFSGPTIIKSILFNNIKSFNSLKFSKFKLIFSAISAVPALPGKQYICSTLFELFKV